MKIKELFAYLVATLCLVVTTSVLEVKAASDSIVDLRIAAITDLHANLMNYDYYTGSEAENLGFTKISTLIKEAKNEVSLSDDETIDNFLLLDNGDTIQGTVLGDYYARIKPLEVGHPVYKALDYLGFDVTTLGNHEFNYGLEYFDNVLKDTKMHVINSNVYNMDGTHRYTPYVVIEETVLDRDGNEQVIKVGICGFVPPQILNWDKLLIEGQVEVKDIVESAQEMVHVLRNEEQVDIVVALSHSGYGEVEYQSGQENVSYQLTLIEGIDAVITGHTHQEFPGNTESINSLPGVDLEKGTMNGIATMMPGNFGRSLGVMDLTLKQDESGKWSVIDATTQLRESKEATVDQDMVEFVKEYHETTVNYVNEPVGKIDRDLNSFLSLVTDDAGVELIQRAQLNFMKKVLETGSAPELEPYKDLPIISAAAPFKAGYSADNYVDIAKGDIAIIDIANLYKYSNTFAVVKVTGKDVKEMLEFAAVMYNTIDPTNAEEQELINKDFPTFNFDTFEGIEYQIDVTQPSRYDEQGNLINEEANRISEVTYQGEPLVEDQEYLILTNNYRAGGGGNYPGIVGKDVVVYEASEETRQVIADYIQSSDVLAVTTNNNWNIKPVANSVATVTFTSNSKATDYLAQHSNISELEKLEDGVSKYKYDLSKTVQLGATDSADAQVSQQKTMIIVLAAVAIIAVGIGIFTFQRNKK